MQNILAIGNKSKQVVSWGEDYVVLSPEVAVRGVKLSRIGIGH